MAKDANADPAFDSRAYRDTLGCFGTGVCVITASAEDGRLMAITANSFSSVSLHPPIILWSIDEASDRFTHFTDAPHFAVNILSRDQEHLSDLFAFRADAEITPDIIDRRISGAVVLKGAIAWMVCRTSWRQKAGDHTVIFGDVQDFSSGPGDALGYYRGKYSTHRPETG